MNQESEQDFPPQEISPANSSHEYVATDSAVPLPVNGGGFTVLQLPQPPTSSSSSAIADSAIKPPLRKCTSCGFGSAKKRSPPPSSLSSLYYEPCSKRPSISSTTSYPDHPTPPSSSERKSQRSPLPLRRSLSDFPCSPIGGAYYQHSSKRTAISTSSPDPTPPSSAERKRQRSPLPLRRSLSDFPCSPVGSAYYYQDFPNHAAAAAASLKKNPLSPSQMLPGNSQDSFPMMMQDSQQPLQRSPSNPSSSSEYYETPAVNTTPPRPRPAPIVRPQMFGHHHGSPPNSKKLRRELKVKVEELMQAVCEPEEDDEVEDEGHVNINCINKEEDEMMNQHQNENEGGDEESVWVKQTEGGGLILHFKCCCGEGYEVFLHGDKCYYRLS